MEGIVLAQSYTMQFSEDGGLVYFMVNVKELFNVSLSYPGIRNAVKKAFNGIKTIYTCKNRINEEVLYNRLSKQ